MGYKTVPVSEDCNCFKTCLSLKTVYKTMLLIEDSLQNMLVIEDGLQNKQTEEKIEVEWNEKTENN